ncbi:hypothetical protein GCM10009864_82590 [Streptomyces lunalinharesii]|uniref:Uncharacterized protein n=1 Tax=Streptomyces lunalinharesii TaxID=333384 RepID=A0ABN3T865_9ACTN
MSRGPAPNASAQSWTNHGKPGITQQPPQYGPAEVEVVEHPAERGDALGPHGTAVRLVRHPAQGPRVPLGRYEFQCHGPPLGEPAAELAAWAGAFRDVQPGAGAAGPGSEPG